MRYGTKSTVLSMGKQWPNQSIPGVVLDHPPASQSMEARCVHIEGYYWPLREILLRIVAGIGTHAV